MNASDSLYRTLPTTPNNLYEKDEEKRELSILIKTKRKNNRNQNKLFVIVPTTPD